MSFQYFCVASCNNNAIFVWFSLICLEIIQPFNHFQKQPPEVFHKESYSQTFCDIHRKTPVQGSIFNKVEVHQACNFIKKRLQHRYFLVNIVKFIRRTILKNISKWLHCWKVFYENVFQIRSEPSKRNYWWLAVWKVAQISQDWIKMLPIIKYYMRRSNSLKRFKFLYKSKTTAIGKSFVKNLSEKRKYFSAEQYQNFMKFRLWTSAMEQNRFI